MQAGDWEWQLSRIARVDRWLMGGTICCFFALILGLGSLRAERAAAQDAQIQLALERHAGVLDSSWASAGRFTNRVAWDLRAAYTLIKKAGGQRCDGPTTTVDCDKIMEREPPYRIYDIAGGAGAAGAHPAWGDTGHTGTFDLRQEPQAYAGAPGEPPPATPPGTPAPDPELLAPLRNLETQLAVLTRAVTDLQTDVRASASQANMGALAGQLGELRARFDNLQDRLVVHGLQLSGRAGGFLGLSGTAKLPPPPE